MTLYTHGLTAESVVSEWPGDRVTAITEDSHGLNLPMIRGWIDTASGLVNTPLEDRGVSDPETQLSDAAARACRQAVVAWVHWRMYSAVRARADLISGARDEWNDHKTALRTMTNVMAGEAVPPSSSIAANFATSGEKKRSRYGRNFKGW